MVSRCDLLRPFLRRDEAISDEIHQDVLSETLGPVPGSVNATVCEGVVTLTGRVAERADIPIVERLCRSVDGVVAVHQSLGYEIDDQDLDSSAPTDTTRPDQ